MKFVSESGFAREANTLRICEPSTRLQVFSFRLGNLVLGGKLAGNLSFTPSRVVPRLSG